MTPDEIQPIVDYAYPKIQKYYGTGKLSIPPIKFHHDIYARLSGDEEQSGEHSSTTKAQYDEDTNVIYIYYPNMENEEDVLRALIHEYTHYKQPDGIDQWYYDRGYTYKSNPAELEALKAEEQWFKFI